MRVCSRERRLKRIGINLAVYFLEQELTSNTISISNKLQLWSNGAIMLYLLKTDEVIVPLKFKLTLERPFLRY